jgi:hypothetical protein
MNLSGRLARMETLFGPVVAPTQTEEDAFQARRKAAFHSAYATLPEGEQQDIVSFIESMPEEQWEHHPILARLDRIAADVAYGDHPGPVSLPQAACTLLRRVPELKWGGLWSERCPACGYGHPNRMLAWWRTQGQDVPPPLAACVACGAAITDPTPEEGR